MNRKIRGLSQQPLVSVTLVGINVILYLLCSIWGNRLYEAGYVGVQSVLTEGEYMRLLWGMFLHTDVDHLFSNMILLLFMGSMLEKEIGHLPYGIIYFTSGICGNLFSLLIRVLQWDSSVSIGASGAIFGLDGLLLVMVLMKKQGMMNITPQRVALMILLSLYSGFSGDAVDNAAHIGGLLTGIVLGFVICRLKEGATAGRNRKKQMDGEFPK